MKQSATTVQRTISRKNNMGEKHLQYEVNERTLNYVPSKVPSVEDLEHALCNEKDLEPEEFHKYIKVASILSQDSNDFSEESLKKKQDADKKREDIAKLILGNIKKPTPPKDS